MSPASETTTPGTVNLTVPRRRSRRYLTEKELGTESSFGTLADRTWLASHSTPFPLGQRATLSDTILSKTVRSANTTMPTQARRKGTGPASALGRISRTLQECNDCNQRTALPAPPLLCEGEHPRE